MTAEKLGLAPDRRLPDGRGEGEQGDLAA